MQKGNALCKQGFPTGSALRKAALKWRKLGSWAGNNHRGGNPLQRGAPEQRSLRGRRPCLLNCKCSRKQDQPRQPVEGQIVIMAVELVQEVKLFGKWSFDDVEVSTLPYRSSMLQIEMEQCMCDRIC